MGSSQGHGIILLEAILQFIPVLVQIFGQSRYMQMPHIVFYLVVYCIYLYAHKYS